MHLLLVWEQSSLRGLHQLCRKRLVRQQLTSNALRPKLNGHHFAHYLFKSIFLDENVWISIEISLKFVPKGPIGNIAASVLIMAWRRPGDKSLSEPMMVSLDNWRIHASLSLNELKHWWVPVRLCIVHWYQNEYDRYAWLWMCWLMICDNFTDCSKQCMTYWVWSHHCQNSDMEIQPNNKNTMLLLFATKHVWKDDLKCIEFTW